MRRPKNRPPEGDPYALVDVDGVVRRRVIKNWAWGFVNPQTRRTYPELTRRSASVQNIGYPSLKDFSRALRTLDEIVRLVELRLEEVERRISLVESRARRAS